MQSHILRSRASARSWILLCRSWHRRRWKVKCERRRLFFWYCSQLVTWVWWWWWLWMKHNYGYMRVLTSAVLPSMTSSKYFHMFVQICWYRLSFPIYLPISSMYCPSFSSHLTSSHSSTTERSPSFKDKATLHPASISLFPASFQIMLEEVNSWITSSGEFTAK